jgi:DNA-binding response OmpR family regulator
MAFRASGMNVRTALDAESALEIVQHKTFDVFLLDLTNCPT